MVATGWGPNKLNAKRELDAGMLGALLGYRLRVAQQTVFRDFARSIPELSPGRAGILLLVEANPGVSQARLAEAVDLDRSTVVGVLHVLERAGWLERLRGADRRTNGLWLTRSGATLLAGVKRRIRSHERRIAARMTPAEREQLAALLEKLAG